MMATMSAAGVPLIAVMLMTITEVAISQSRGL